MSGRQRLAVAGAALAFTLGGTGVALAATGEQVRATCTPNPLVSGKTVVAFDVHCSVPLPTTTKTVTATRTVTATVTATQTVTASPSTTTEPEPSTTTTEPEPTTTTPSSTTTAPPVTTTTATSEPDPPTSQWPDATNTGVQPGVTLTPSGSLNVYDDDAVIENLDITGRLNIYGRNVTVRNVKVHTSALEEWAVVVREQGSASFDHVEVYGLDKSTRHVQYAILSFSDYAVSINHANLHHCADCVQGEKVTLTNSYIHDMSNPPGSHVDGFQCNSTCEVTICDNRIILDYTQTGAISLFADFGTPRNSIVDHNYVSGGGYTMYLGGPKATGIVVTNNVFGRDVWPNCGYWGPYTSFAPGGAGNAFSGNTWDDGAPLG